MQTRHRIPTIFNLSMVDMLCCALGCVILLWLVYFKEARTRAIIAGEAGKQLTATKSKLEDVSRDLIDAQQTVLAGSKTNEQLRSQLLEITNQRDVILAKWEKTDKDHQAAVQSLKDAKVANAGLQKDVKNLQALQDTAKALLAQKGKDYTALAEQLAQKGKDYTVVAEQLLAATQRIGDLDKLINEQKAMLLAAAEQANALKAKLTASEKLAGQLENEVGMLKILAKEYSEQLAKVESKAATLSTDLGNRKMDLAEATKRIEALLALKQSLELSLAAAKHDLARQDKDFAAAKDQLTKNDKDFAAVKDQLAKSDKELAAAKLLIDSREQELAAARLASQGLVGETKILKQEVNKLKAAAENRFAGIELKGQRVLFLVDMSGSMRMKDYYIEDPDKWPLVCEILGKLIQSLPDLQQFQIILFSDALRYPLGNNGKWQDYRGPESVKTAVEAVRAVTPQNETNMSAVFEEAFRFRPMGLDTIYLLSDGLPNIGDGLPVNAQQLSDSDKGAILSKYIRDQLKAKWNVPQGREIKQRVRINTVGFFFDSPDVGAFLWALARDNDGSFVGLSKP